MSEYLAYWHPKTVKETPPEMPIYYMGSKNFKRVALRKGDVLWLVTSPRTGELRVVGRIPVERITNSRARAEVWANGNSVWQDADQWAFGRPEGARKKQNIDVSSLASKLTFQGVRRLPARFNGQHLQTLRRLEPASIDLLDQVWGDRTNDGGHRRFVDFPGDIRENVAAFNDQARKSVNRTRKLLSGTMYWVYDPDSETFGPGKFVGLKDITLTAYEKARDGVTGSETHDRIEAVLEDVFIERSELTGPLQTWGEGLLGAGAFGNANPEKWRFVVLRPHAPKKSGRKGRQASDLGEATVISRRVAAQDGEVTRHHLMYQQRLKAWFAKRHIEVEFEEDFVDVRFTLNGSNWIGEVKVTVTNLSRDEAFRSALGQVLFYAYVTSDSAPRMIIFLDFKPDPKAMQLAERLNIAVVAEVGNEFRLLNPETAPVLTKVFASAAVAR